MQFKVGRRMVTIEYQVIIIVLICVAWALYYLQSTISVPDEGPESVLFIKPLVAILALSAVFVMAGAVKIGRLDETRSKSSDRGILHPQRMIFAISLFIYTALLPLLGFLIPSVIYLGSMCFYLGLRKVWLYFCLWIGYGLLLWIAFKKLMGVPIPIWPDFY
jgi:hypothetical protein